MYIFVKKIIMENKKITPPEGYKFELFLNTHRALIEQAGDLV